VVLVVALACVASCSGDASDPNAQHRVRSDPMRASVTVPRTWETEQGTLASPYIKAWHDKYFVDETCGHRADFTAAGVLIEPEGAGAPTDTFPPRPKVITDTSGTGLVSGSSDLSCGQRAQFVEFTDGARHFRVSIFLGRDATRKTIAQAYAIVNSLRV
jgi:hypothetical protein